MSSSSSSNKSPHDHSFLDEPLIQLTQRCQGDLRQVLNALFSFLQRRTDFYYVAHPDDLKEGQATMGFAEGQAEKLLLASFRQFPLRRVPKGAGFVPKVVPKVEEKTPKKDNSQPTPASSDTTPPIRRTAEGKQIPVGNGGTTDRYVWTQTLEECTVLVKLPAKTRAKDLTVSLQPKSLSVALKTPDKAAASFATLQGDWYAAIDPDESTWTLEHDDNATATVLTLSLYKKVPNTFWTFVLKGDDEIDASLVDSRRHISTYQEDTQAQIRRLMHEQQSNKSSPKEVAAAQPLTPQTIPTGAEYIDRAKMESISRGDAKKPTTPTSSSSLPPHIAQYLRKTFGQDPVAIEDVPSAQQSVLIVHYDPSVAQALTASAPPQVKAEDLAEDDPETLFKMGFATALSKGRNRLVVRQWKGGARWWNLQHPQSQDDGDNSDPAAVLAQSEMAAYRIAWQVLRRKKTHEHKVPAILHDSFDDEEEDADKKNTSAPWALFEYVGPQAERFSLLFDDDHHHPHYQHNAYWKDSMVRTRHEFGFDEPHPRWGRVPVDECVHYAQTLLTQIVFPLHHWFLQQIQVVVKDNDLRVKNLHGKVQHLPNPNVNGDKPWTYEAMVQTYRAAHTQLVQAVENSDDSDNDAKLKLSIQALGQCIEHLEAEAPVVQAPLFFTLVHMDLQPQNVVMSDPCASAPPSGTKEPPTLVSSVLDWEEAAYADPRFELLLLGRKVCANVEQAQQIWDFYNVFLKAVLDDHVKVDTDHPNALSKVLVSDSDNAPPDRLGPIDPWLHLETVHSLCQLLLQAQGQSSGRSPWETKPDLWGKIAREWGRLATNEEFQDMFQDEETFASLLQP